MHGFLCEWTHISSRTSKLTVQLLLARCPGFLEVFTLHVHQFLPFRHICSYNCDICVKSKVFSKSCIPSPAYSFLQIKHFLDKRSQEEIKILWVIWSWGKSDK